MEKIERYKKIFGEDFEYPERKEVWQLRANTIKISSNELEKRLKEKYEKIEKQKFFKDAFLIESEENLGKTLEHILGYFFIQNFSSMIPPLVLEPSYEDKILDLTAAPGAKTTQMAALMENCGLIVANDIEHKRLKALRGNLQRCGVINTVVTKMDGKIFFKTNLTFNKILLDAPCTATGLMSPKVLSMTSEGLIKKLSNIQKQLIQSAARCLKKEGILIYSTCSLEPEENEEVIDFAMKKLDLIPEKIKIKGVNFINGLTGWEGKTFREEVFNAIRIIPDGIFEGFFVCKLRKY
ncbi:MAG: RsmB/NOP family class I SAM-dependent RNA methyltransferase [Candidatus Aenigmatarchaeota archaeon]